MEEAFEEGQGPHRAVEPVMMMMYIYHLLPYEPFIIMLPFFIGHDRLINSVVVTLSLNEQSYTR
jgi:hypothetical protein